MTMTRAEARQQIKLLNNALIKASSNNRVIQLHIDSPPTLAPSVKPNYKSTKKNG